MIVEFLGMCNPLYTDGSFAVESKYTGDVRNPCARLYRVTWMHEGKQSVMVLESNKVDNNPCERAFFLSFSYVHMSHVSHL